MRMSFAALLFLAAACGGKEAKKEAPTPPPVVSDAAQASAPIDAAVAQAEPAPPPPTRDPGVPDGYDFTPTAQALLVVGACGDGPIPDGFSESLIKSHCEEVKKTQADYAKSWLDTARPFIAERVPKGLPKKVVYPFAGGDLSTALTVYPDADEITTLSLEPAGDPRTLDALNTPKGKPSKAKPVAPQTLTKALATVRYELDFLYRVNFSNTMNMIDAMRGGALPTQLIFGLSAMKVHGYEVVSLHYFKLDEQGVIAYLAEADVKNAPAVGVGKADSRNRIFANAELRFRKPGGRIQIYRHIQVNLDDLHLKKDPRVLRHLEAKGPIAGMTKAASYLLSWESFKTMREYMIKNVVWMISDATGIGPKWGKPAGFEYETYGQFTGPHIGAGNQISKNWEEEFKSQPKRQIPFRFGYYDKKGANHLVIMRKKA
ncbi:MAG: hypothetical protein M4D80_07740 [Myxococcota bacterium]|nr:hypothetical protein [Myxococcota bacterium]